MRKATTGQHLEARKEDASEHHDGASAQHGLRDGGEERSDDGEQAAKDQDDGSRGDRKAIDHLRHRRQANVLREGGDRRTTKETRYDTDESVASHRGAHLRLMHASAQRARAKRRGVANSLGGRHEVNADDGQDRVQVKLRLERQHLRHSGDRRIVHHRKIDHAHGPRQDIACDEANQHGEGTKQALAKEHSHQADHQRERSDNPVMKAAEIGRALSARKAIGSDGKERETDGGHHRGCHDMGNQLGPLVWKKAQKALHHTAHDNGSHQRTHALVASDRDGQRKEGERDTHHDRQARAHLPDGIQLHKGADAGNDHTILNQSGTDALIQAYDARQDDDRGDVGHEHGQDVLKSEGNGLRQRHSSIQLIYTRHNVLFLFYFLGL